MTPRAARAARAARSRNRRTVVRFPVFSDYEVHVILSKDLVRTGRRLGVDLRGAHGAFVTSTDTQLKGVIVLAESTDADTIAHESSHAIRHLFRAVGARRDDEAFAYHLGYLVGRIHRFLEES